MLRRVFIFSSIIIVVWFTTAEGSNFAFICLNEEFWQVFSIDNNGGNLKQITHSPVDKANVSWSSETDKLLINTNLGDLMVADIKTTKIHSIDIGIRGMTDAVWSPNGRHVLFSLSIANSIDANDIWLAEIATAKVKKLTSMKLMQHDPAWTRDAKGIVFLSGGGGQEHDLWRLDLKSKNITQMTVGQLYHFEPACSIADEIAFSSNRLGDYEIWVCDLAGTKFEQITHSPGLDGQPAWSPDGKQIAFSSARGGYPAIWVVNRDGSGSHQISPDGMQCRGPAWSQ